MQPELKSWHFSDQFRHLLLLNRFSNQLEAKFCEKPPWVGGGGGKSLFVVSGSHDQGHMATKPACIYGKNLSKSSPEPVDRFPRDLVCSIRDSGPSEFVQMMILG